MKQADPSRCERCQGRRTVTPYQGDPQLEGRVPCPACTSAEPDPTQHNPVPAEGAGYRLIDNVTGIVYEPTGEYRMPRDDEDWLDPKAAHVYTGSDDTRACRIILRRLTKRSVSFAEVAGEQVERWNSIEALDWISQAERHGDRTGDVWPFRLADMARDAMQKEVALEQAERERDEAVANQTCGSCAESARLSAKGTR